MEPISWEQLRREMQQLCEIAQIGPHVVVHAPSVTEEHKDNCRRYAQMYFHSEGFPVFEFADQARWLDWPHRAGLYMHEIGHALDFGTEEAADRAAMEAFGVLIVYDPAWPGKGLQTAVF